MTINVLGTNYEIIFKANHEDRALQKNDGYCDTSTHTIVIDDMQHANEDVDAKGNLDEYRKQVIRHELTHAILFESGLSANSWAENEETVDWFAIQFPKMFKIFNDAHCL